MAHSIHDTPRTARSKERRPEQPEPPDLAEAVIQLATVLSTEIHHLATAIQSLGSGASGAATKTDLLQLEEKTIMKLSEVKAQVAESAARSTEAFAELGTRIADLQKQIEDLQSGNTDPEVTDEEFTANLATLKTNVDALADIVPAPDAPPTP